jgi:prolyl oligopeptidase
MSRMRSPWIVPFLIAAACGGTETKAVAPTAVPASAVTPSSSPPPPPAAATVAPPVAEKRAASNTYHGVKVEDPYQWLEGDDAAVKAWSDGQNRYARGILDGLPLTATVAAEVKAYMTAPITRYWGMYPVGSKLFAFRKLPTKQQPDIVVMDGPDGAARARLVLDPTAGGDPHTSIDWFEPSPDGTKVAVAISSGGSESASLHVIDLEGKDLEPVIPNVQFGTGGGDVAWRPDSKGLWYTRYPSKGEKPDAELQFWMQLWFHQLGTPVSADRYELGKDFPKIAEVKVATDARGRALVTVSNGDGGIHRHYLRDAKGWRAIDDWSDQIMRATFGASDDLWLVSTKDALRGKVLRLPARARDVSGAVVVVPEGKDAIDVQSALVATKDRLFVVYQAGGPNQLRTFSLDGKPTKAPALPAVAAVSLVSHPLGEDVIVNAETYTTPDAWYRVEGRTAKVTKLAALSAVPPVSLEGWETRRELATSKDGTKIPLNIVWRTGAPQDGSTPCLVTAYGGYGISSAPWFNGSQYPLLRRGVCVVEVNIRGGGEFGEAWHRAGMLTSKQNVFDDFAAALDYLVAARYTRPDRIAIIGGSNGGLLMGAMITQHPDKMKAVISGAGIYDMLRVELSANGEYNTTEFGTVKDEAQFRALYAYSPYHHVTAGTSYPAVLMTVGANDPRVLPWQSSKIIAALQAAQAGKAPILLRTSEHEGHGMGSAMDERIAKRAHNVSFVLWQLGIDK